MLIQGVVGQPSVSSIQPGANPALRQGQLGDAIMSELHGRYYEGSYRKNRFGAANQAGVTSSVGNATTFVGICLSNPNGSAVNLVVEKFGYAQLVAFAAAAIIGLSIGQSTTNVTHTTPLTPKSKFVGSGITPVGLVDSNATLPVAPTLDTILGAALTGAITTVPGLFTWADLGGDLIIPPGGYVCSWTGTASGGSGFAGAFQWEEVPV